MIVDKNKIYKSEELSQENKGNFDPFFLDYSSIEKRLYDEEWQYFFRDSGEDNILFIMREDYENVVINKKSVLYPIIEANNNLQLNEEDEFIIPFTQMGMLGLDISFQLVKFFGDIKYRLFEEIGGKRVIQHCVTDEFLDRIKNGSFVVDDRNFASIYQFCVTYLLLLFGYEGMIEIKKFIKNNQDPVSLFMFIADSANNRIFAFMNEYEISCMKKDSDDKKEKFLHDISFQIVEFSKMMFFLEYIKRRIDKGTNAFTNIMNATMNVFDSMYRQGVREGSLFIPVSYDYSLGRKSDLLVYQNEDLYMEDEKNGNTVNAIGVCIRVLDKERVSIYNSKFSDMLFYMFGSNLSVFVDNLLHIETRTSESKREFDIRTLEILHDQVKHIEKECGKECENLTNKQDRNKIERKYANENICLIENRMTRLRRLNEVAYFNSLRWFRNNLSYLFSDLCVSDVVLCVLTLDAKCKIFDLNKMCSFISSDIFSEDMLETDVTKWDVSGNDNGRDWDRFYLSFQDKNIFEFNLGDNVGCISMRIDFSNSYDLFMKNFEITSDTVVKKSEGDENIETTRKKKDIFKMMRDVKQQQYRWKNRKFNTNAKYVLRVMNPNNGDYDYIYEEDLYKDPEKGGVLGKIGILNNKKSGTNTVERFSESGSKNKTEKDHDMEFNKNESEPKNKRYDNKRKEIISKITAPKDSAFVEDIKNALDYIEDRHLNYINAGISEIGVFSDSEDFKFFLKANPGTPEEQKIFDYSHGTYGIMSGKIAFNIDNIATDLTNVLKTIVILHEFFHAHFFGTLRVKQGQSLSPASKDDLNEAVEFFIVYGEEDEYMRGSSQDKSSGNTPESVFISEYAQIDDVENYAETAAYYHVLPEDLKAKNEKLYNIFNSYFKRYNNGESKESN